MEMTPTQPFPRIINQQLKEYKKIGVLRREVLDRFSVNVTYQGLVITLGQIGYYTAFKLSHLSTG